MKQLLCIFLLAFVQLAMGQYYDPPLLNPDPFKGSGALIRTRGTTPAASADSTPAASAPVQVDTTPVDREKTRVAILGYHNFSTTSPVTQMLMRTSDFRAQMERIRKSGYKVISMQEFLDWRFGELKLPEKCILITIDDGWKSVYTDAYPILKEYGYPFTLFLYTKFISGRGTSMSPEMIREMQKNGATVGSHSTTHYYPSHWKKTIAQGEEPYKALIDQEIVQSGKKLRELFGPVNTYCYPGGYHTPEMISSLEPAGYKAAFTVIPGKVTCEEDPMQIRRYMLFGNDGSIFDRAINFSSDTSSSSQQGALPTGTPPPPFPVTPQANSSVTPDIPVISAQLNGQPGVNYSSIRMKVSGFGTVPAQIDSNTGVVRWTPPYRIYMPHLSVHLTWTTNDGTRQKAEWSFTIKREVAE